jgi:hypothetical protein
MWSSADGVFQESQAGLHREIRGHIEIPLGFIHAVVSEVRRQVRQQPLHVLTLAVPTDQSIQRERVAVMPMSA